MRKSIHNLMPVLLVDGYKIGHPFQYPKDLLLVYSNFTARMSRVPSLTKTLGFGYQYLAAEYLLHQFNENFFERDRDVVLKEYKRRIDNYLGPLKSYDHIANLHELGYLPLRVKAVPEGTLVPLRVPSLTICNTHQDFGWLTNTPETLLSNVLWQGITSATTAFHYRVIFERFAKETGASFPEFVKWQGHDFSMRGMSGIEAAAMSGAAHLLSFTGTDTIPAIDFLELYYGADCEKELIGGSVPATEHSVMSIGEQGHELETFKHLLTEVYPTGILSVVSDTWDFWKVVTEYLPALKEIILARDGKLVIRPDSGDPVLILCGDGTAYGLGNEHIRAGLIQCLWDTFGGTINAAGYKELDPHIGDIYGDSITPERQFEILSRLKAKGFASTNSVLGIGSFTYQHVTRDTFGQAMKATYAETRSHGPQAIFKKPATDDGMKNSAKGLLVVEQDVNSGVISLREDATWADESTGLLRTIFEDSKLYNFQTLSDIRKRVDVAVAKEIES